MTYRDRLLTCPRCGKTLERTTRHEHWPCSACGGVAVGVGELIRLLLRYAPELLPHGGVGGLETAPRSTSELPLRCPACSAVMKAVLLHEVQLERCGQDELLWFDANQLDVVIDAAIADVEARKGWGQRLRDLLFAN